MTAHQSPPTHVGRYRVDERLGQGGMGEVYRGYDTRLERPVALKRIIPEGAKRATAVRRFRREAKAAARLGHSAIVQLFDWLEQDDSYWIVMEWVAGPTLRDVLRGGVRPWSQGTRIVCDIAAGLAAAHDIGIVHRDLKPSNIMFTGHGEIRIMDFGLAKQVGVSEHTPLSAVSEMGLVIGTVTAMSPEQAQGRPVDHRSDLFSLGALYYELLTGQSPFRARTPVKVLIRVCTEDPPPVHTVVVDLPAPLSELVARMLDKDPEKRPTSAREVADTLEPFAAPRAVMRGLGQTSGPRSGQASDTPLAGPPDAEASGSEPSDPDDNSRLAVTAGLSMGGVGNEWTRSIGDSAILEPASAEVSEARSESPDDDTPLID